MHPDSLLVGETAAVCCSQIIDRSKQKVEGETHISHADEIFKTCQPIQTNALLLSTMLTSTSDAAPLHIYYHESSSKTGGGVANKENTQQ